MKERICRYKTQFSIAISNTFQPNKITLKITYKLQKVSDEPILHFSLDILDQ